MTRFIDTDTHLTDHDPGWWSARLPRALRDQAPRMVDVGGTTRLQLGALSFPRSAGPACGNPRGLEHLIAPGDDADRSAFMTENGIAAAVLQPGFVGLSLHAVPDPRARTGLAHLYNELVLEACEGATAPLYGAVLLSLEDPAWSLRELRARATQDAFVAAVTRPTARHPRARLSDPRFQEVLEACTEAEMPLFLHAGTGCYQWSPLAEGFARYELTHALAHMGENLVGVVDLLCDARPPPSLRVGLLESGAGWIPSLLAHLDHHFIRLAPDQPPPSEIFRRGFAVALHPGEADLSHVVGRLGADAVLFGSDYPHWDTVRADEWRRALGDLVGPERSEANALRMLPRLARRLADTDGRKRGSR